MGAGSRVPGGNRGSQRQSIVPAMRTRDAPASVAAQRSPSALTTSTQLAAASSAAPGGLANEILIPRRKRLTPLISHHVKPNPNTRRGAGGRPWQRWGQGAAAAAHPGGAPTRRPETGAVYGGSAGLGDTLFLHVAIVTETIIKLRLNRAEETDLSAAII